MNGKLFVDFHRKKQENKTIVCIYYIYMYTSICNLTKLLIYNLMLICDKYKKKKKEKSITQEVKVYLYFIREQLFTKP